MDKNLTIPVSDWEPLGEEDELREKIWSKQRTFFEDVWFRFSHKKSAFVGLLIILLLMLFAFIGPYFTSYSFDSQKLDFTNIPPLLEVTNIDGDLFYITPNLKVVNVSPGGKLLSALDKKHDNPAEKITYFTFKGKEIVLSYAKKPAALLNKEGKRLVKDNRVWNTTFLLGTDGLGRDLLTRLMYGTKISLIVAFIATLVNMTIGMIYGGISAYVGGNVDAVMMRVVDIISTVPLTLYVILIMVVLSDGFLSIIIALSSVYWVTMARVVRGQIFSLKENEFVYAAKTIGSSQSTILFRHLLPNAMGPILVTATMMIPSAIFMEAFLGFIGIGIAAPMASLGTMCNDSIQMLRTNPYQLLMPSLMICLIMFAFNYVGDGLRDALDPKLKK